VYSGKYFDRWLGNYRFFKLTTKNNNSNNSVYISIGIMAPDQYKVICSLITTKATHVSVIQERSRYGSNAKTKIAKGVAVEVVVNPSNPTS
jgi:hypothetical protein